MTATTLARAAGVLGGLCWVARALLDDGEAAESVVNALHYGGLALLVLALLGIGAGLVSDVAALRVVVTVCLLALAATVLEFLHQQYADPAVNGVLGALTVLYCLAGLVAPRGRRADRPRVPKSRRTSRSHADK